MHDLLKAAGDPDYAIFAELGEGVTAGVLHDMPRAPQVYEELTRWRLDQDPISTAVQEASNYRSAEEEGPWLQEHLRSGVQVGRMERVPREQLRERFGEHYAVASVAVLVSPSGKRRLIHDGTRHVAVNHRFRCRNKLRFPGPREKGDLLRAYEKEKEVLFALATDVKSAHRLVKVKPDEWGMLACAIREEPDAVYVNKVGTFGISSAAEWWSAHLPRPRGRPPGGAAGLRR